MFRPPVNRAMRALDRTFFNKHAVISAARVLDTKNTARLRSEIFKSKDMLQQRTIQAVQLVSGSDSNQKCILLRPDIKHDGKSPCSRMTGCLLSIAEDESTWSATVSRLEIAGEISLMPYTLYLDYEHWTARM